MCDALNTAEHLDAGTGTDGTGGKPVGSGGKRRARERVNPLVHGVRHIRSAIDIRLDGLSIDQMAGLIDETDPGHRYEHLP